MQKEYNFVSHNFVSHKEKDVKFVCEFGIENVNGNVKQHWKRSFIVTDEFIAYIKEQLSKKSDTLHVVPIRITSKYACSRSNVPNAKKPDSKKHTCYLVINPVSKRMYLYDFFSYNLEYIGNFSVKLLNNKMKLLEDKLGFKFFKGVFSKSLVAKMVKWNEKAIVWFPILCFLELMLMMNYPNEKRAGIQNKIIEMSDADLFKTADSILDKLNSYYIKKVFKPCDDTSKIFNPESGRCVLSDHKTGMTLKGFTKSKICNEDQYFNIQTDKCKRFAFLKPDTHPNAQDRQSTFLNGHGTSNPTIKFLTRKYPHTAFYKFSPKENKEDNGLVWENRPGNNGILHVTPHLLAFWKKALANPKVNQIVTFIELHTYQFDILHLNVLIHTKSTKETELFEPVGSSDIPEFDLDSYKAAVEKLLKDIGITTKLITPADYCPKKMYIFQSLETDEYSVWNTVGYCAVWTLWYTEIRLSNPDLKTKTVIKFAMDKLKDYGSLRYFIWNYDQFMKRSIYNSKIV